MGPFLTPYIRVCVNLLRDALSLFKEQGVGIPGKDPERIEQKQKQDDDFGHHRFCNVSHIAVEHEFRAFHLGKKREWTADNVRIKKDTEYYEYEDNCQPHNYLSMSAPFHSLT